MARALLAAALLATAQAMVGRVPAAEAAMRAAAGASCVATSAAGPIATRGMSLDKMAPLAEKRSSPIPVASGVPALGAYMAFERNIIAAIAAPVPSMATSAGVLADASRTAASISHNSIKAYNCGLCAEAAAADGAVYNQIHLCNKEESSTYYPPRDAYSGARPTGDGHHGSGAWRHRLQWRLGESLLLAAFGGTVLVVRARRARARRVLAAVCIQGLVRGRAARCALLLARHCRARRHAAAIRLQTWTRKVLARMDFGEARFSVGIIQAVWRARRAWQQARLDHAAAAIIQSGGRLLLVRWRLLAMFHDLDNGCSCYDLVSFRKELYQERLLYRVPMLRIQAAARGYLVRSRLRLTELRAVPTLRIQAAARGYLVRSMLRLAELRAALNGTALSTVVWLRTVYGRLNDLAIFVRAVGGKSVSMGTLLHRYGKAKKASSAKKQRGRKAQSAKASGKYIESNGALYAVGGCYAYPLEVLRSLLTGARERFLLGVFSSSSSDYDSDGDDLADDELDMDNSSLIHLLNISRSRRNLTPVAAAHVALASERA